MQLKRVFRIKNLAALILLLAFARARQKGDLQGLGKHLRSFSFRPYLTGLGFAVALVLISIFFLDQRVADFIVARRDLFWVRETARFGGLLGANSELWIILSVAYMITSFMRVWDLVSKTILGATLSNLLTSLVVQGMKFAFMRARPYSAEGPFSFFNLKGLWENAHAYQSLASGDVAVVAGAASYFFFAVRSRILRILIALLPLATALQRVVDEKHWCSDTLAAMAVSLVVGHFIWSWRKIRI